MQNTGGKKRAALAALMLALVFVQQAAAQTAQAGAEPDSNYFSAETILSGSGAQLEKYIISGPPKPPAGYELERSAAALPGRIMGANTLTVPAFSWIFGCSAVSGAMIAGYYDRTGFPNMYTGPTNGGVMPLDSSSWSTWTDAAGATYRQNPLIASRNGLDGRAARGSLDDYWVSYLSGVQDPYITNSWTQHAWGDAIGDYMKTSQSAFGNNDASTVFYNWTSLTAPLTCSDMESNNITVDGTYGRKLFYEAKGYTVGECYNQKTDNNGGGFTFALFKAEIDAGRPVLLNLAGHSIVGVGYDDTSSTVYIHDTWDYLAHTMTWGGSYSGMALLSVSIVNISSPASDFTYTVSNNTVTITGYTGSGGVVEIPDTIDGMPVKIIGYSAFENTASITAITIPDSVYFIEFNAFAGCTGLTSITISADIYYDINVFKDCTGLTSITIQDGVTRIPNRMFSGCTGLTGISLPASVMSIGEAAFAGCTGLTSVAMPGVTSIDWEAFSGCTGLTSMHFPASVRSIGLWAFNRCTSLTAAYFYGNAPGMGEAVFDNCASGFTVYYLAGATGFTNPWCPPYNNCYPAVALTDDEDGVPLPLDNCPNSYNPQQLDADQDGTGDMCDTSPGCGGCGQSACEQYADADNDGSIDATDNCPNTCNAQQLDADSDGTGDVCDTSPGCGGCGQSACEQQCGQTTTTTTIVARFLDNNNGTVKDTRTGLVWLKNANSCGTKYWDEAIAYCGSLASGTAGLTDGSVAGNWRLPTIAELQGIGTDPPSVWEFDLPQVAWTMPGTPFINMQPNLYYSSTSNFWDLPLFLHMEDGWTQYNDPQSDHCYVLPVRAGILNQVAYFPFNGNAHDASGMGNNGTVYGATFTEDRFGTADSAVHFDGIDDYIDIGQGVFGLTTELTISLWVKLDGPNGSYQTFIRKGASINPFSLRLSGTQVQGGVRTGVTNYVLNSGMDYGVWRHVALTYKDGALTVYLNGVQDGAIAASGALNVSSTAYTYIGKSPDAANPYYTKGTLDDIVIYNRALTAAEIESLYNLESGIAP